MKYNFVTRKGISVCVCVCDTHVNMDLKNFFDEEFFFIFSPRFFLINFDLGLKLV